MGKSRKIATRRAKSKIKSYNKDNKKDLVMKPYSYVFKTLPCVLTGSATVSGTFTFAAPTATLPNCSGFPLLGTGSISGASGSFGVVQNSATDFPNYGDFGLATAFQLSDLKNYTNYTNLYDAYCIDRIDVYIEYLSNNASVNTTSILPSVYIYNDQDDALPANLLSNVVGKQGVRMVQFANKQRTLIKHSIIPRTAVQLAEPVGTGLAVNKPHQWINCTTPSVPHYGLKMYFTDMNSGTGNNTCVKFTFKYHVRFRAPIIAL